MADVPRKASRVQLERVAEVAAANRRFAAAVNFCQHIPTELLEALTKERVGAATLIQWIRRCNSFIDDEDYCNYAVCPQCSHVVSHCSPHDDECLLKKTLDTIGEEV